MPPDGIVAEAKKVRLWTYEDDVEGRRNNTDEEQEEAVPEKKEDLDIKEAQERADQAELAQLLSRKPSVAGKSATKKQKVNWDALVGEDQVLCGSALSEMVSPYSQYELCQEAD